MSNGLKVSDTVRLKSGGPKMTIDYIGPRVEGGKTNSALCSWFEKNKRMTDWFELTSLAPA